MGERKRGRAYMDAVNRLTERPSLRDELGQFTAAWGLDGYTPPEDVRETVRGLVRNMLHDASLTDNATVEKE